MAFQWGQNWRKIALSMEGRDAEACRARYDKLLGRHRAAAQEPAAPPAREQRAGRAEQREQREQSGKRANGAPTTKSAKREAGGAPPGRRGYVRSLTRNERGGDNLGHFKCLGAAGLAKELHTEPLARTIDGQVEHQQSINGS